MELQYADPCIIMYELHHNEEHTRKQIDLTAKNMLEVVTNKIENFRGIVVIVKLEVESSASDV
jgi:hypothetical protein